MSRRTRNKRSKLKATGMFELLTRNKAMMSSTSKGWSVGRSGGRSCGRASGRTVGRSVGLSGGRAKGRASNLQATASSFWRPIRRRISGMFFATPAAHCGSILSTDFVMRTEGPYWCASR